MRSWQAWQQHPQGLAVNAEQLIQRQVFESATDKPWPGSAARPLAGIKVLDLTRVLAGPVASRFLAIRCGCIAVELAHLERAGVVPEMTLGKRLRRLGLKSPEGRQVFEALLKDADVLFHGYRADALEQLGYTAGERQHLAPGLIDVSLNAYRLERAVAQSSRFRQPGADEQRHCRGGHGLEAGG